MTEPLLKGSPRTDDGPEIRCSEETLVRKFVCPRYVAQTDQCVVGIILSHVCWGTQEPPPPSPPSRPLCGPFSAAATRKVRGVGPPKGAQTTPTLRNPFSEHPSPEVQWVVALPLCFVFSHQFVLSFVPTPLLKSCAFESGCNPVALGGWRCETGYVYRRFRLHLCLACVDYVAPSHYSPARKNGSWKWSLNQLHNR